MKTTGILLVLFLTFCCFSGVNSNDENDITKISCNKYKYQDFTVCPRIYSPVCGTNGKTYKHECRICEENMKSGENIGKKHRDKCAEEIYCGIRVSPAPACTREYKAHCGSNDETYNNKCEFCNAVWESMTPLTLKYMGKCESTPQES